MIVRPVKTTDLSELMKITQEGAKGMTTLPRDEEQWLRLIDHSKQSFASLPTPEKNASLSFLMVLEEADGQISGTSAIYTPMGYDRPFYNYKITSATNVSPEHDIRVETNLLQLANDYNGAAEVGTLILRTQFRGGGRGRLLALARYMLIGAFMDAFPEQIIAEIRGWRDPVTDSTPFWDAVGKRFFTMPFDDADILSGRDFRFIADLMPRIPIYTALLPDEAQQSIGQPHIDARPAYEMLLKQGFRFNNSVDIFDAGPCLEVYKGDITTVRRTIESTLNKPLVDASEQKPTSIVSNVNADSFTVAYGYDSKQEGVQTDPQFLVHAKVQVGDTVNSSPLGSR